MMATNFPSFKIQSDEEIANFIKDTCETEYHPSCSNKMGKVSKSCTLQIIRDDAITD